MVLLGWFLNEHTVEFGSLRIKPATERRPHHHRNIYENYGDLGYNVLIGRNGTIYGGRSLKNESAAVSHNNLGNIGIAFIGDFSSKPVSKRQLESAKALVAVFEYIYPISSVKTHAYYDSNRQDELKWAQGQLKSILK
jgi:hypothetical protein